MTTLELAQIALACPLSGQPLQPLDNGALSMLQQWAAQRALRNENAGLVDAGFEAALQTGDGRRAYLVYAGVADLRPGSAVLL